MSHDGSLPTRERGLKSEPEHPLPDTLLSLPTRERGLKFCVACCQRDTVIVAPYTGAWIEIGIEEIKAALASSRSLHGSVD